MKQNKKELIWKHQTGGTFKPYQDMNKEKAYQLWKKTAPYNLYSTDDTNGYNLRGYWEDLGSPKSWKEGMVKNNLKREDDGFFHGSSVSSSTGEFLKPKNHPSVQLELDWYNSPDAKEFRNQNKIDSSGVVYKYVPIKKEQGGLLAFKKGGIIKHQKGNNLEKPKSFEEADKKMIKDWSNNNINPSKYELPKQEKTNTPEFLFNAAVGTVEPGATIKDFYDLTQSKTKADLLANLTGTLLPGVSGKMVSQSMNLPIAKPAFDVVNLSDEQRIKLYKKYGAGYYNKWVNDNTPDIFKKGGYLKDKNTYVTKDGKETKRGLWANVYLKNKS